MTWVDREIGGRPSVLARTFDSLGVPLSDPVELGVGGAGTGASDHIRPAVAAGADGRFFVVWIHDLETESVVLGQLVDRDGHLAGARATVSERGRLLSEPPSVRRGTDGGFLVSWMHEVSESERLNGVFVRLYNGSGQALGEVTEIGGDPLASSHAVAVDGRGGFLAVWQSTSSEGEGSIFGQHLDSAGAPVGGKLLVVAPDPASHYGLDLASISGEDLVVAFTRESDLLGRRLAADLRGGTFHLTGSATELEALGIGENGFTGGLTSAAGIG